ncbi:MAG TPA: DEAD/DEAH box helicase [Verrucomicrobiae bacterium]|nr:DEAD/DEAH box helicase [Verrucomicrobiae bacterium]
MSRVDPLPHQLDAGYNHLLKSARVRFLLADDAGARKTIMAGLLLKELKLRGLAERVLIICPANLPFQCQREMADRFQEQFHILRGDLRVQYGVNLWNDKPQIITSMDLAKRDEIVPSLRQADEWDLVIVDEAHRMSARDTEHKSERYKLGEILRDKTAQKSPPQTAKEILVQAFEMFERNSETVVPVVDQILVAATKAPRIDIKPTPAGRLVVTLSEGETFEVSIPGDLSAFRAILARVGVICGAAAEKHTISGKTKAFLMPWGAIPDKRAVERRNQTIEYASAVVREQPGSPLYKVDADYYLSQYGPEYDVFSPATPPLRPPLL